MGASQSMVRMTAAQCRLMVFFPNRTIARTDSENAAKFHSLATAPTPYIHMYTLHRYREGLGCSEPNTTRVADVLTMKTTPNPITNPASRRLMRNRRSVLGIDLANASATTVIPITAPATSMITAIRVQ